VRAQAPGAYFALATLISPRAQWILMKFAARLKLKFACKENCEMSHAMKSLEGIIVKKIANRHFEFEIHAVF
jgi:hypothetical protein